MSDQGDHRHDDDEAEGLAAEYVLGTLPLAERIAAENLAKTQPGFAARIAAWEQHFAPLNADYVPVPAPNLLPQIEARLFGRADPDRRPGLFGRLRSAFAGAAVAAALVVGALYLLPAPEPAAPALTATLAAEAQPLTFAAVYDPSSDALTLTQTAGPAAETGRVYELWLIAGEAAPVSLGVIDAQSITRPLADLAPGAVLAVSLEPTGGSTTGAPTGPVLVTGVVASL
ncbi:anti-sigma factor [Fertoebacter nigrum]|uniref:Anti-sigma factor n=1 Tax=Fertoeibacter niger TaxID=2656921 RepID=A0A8X8KLR3_9RHOB|nr:anti-sigma factor [Fertoeibacter niger]NUB43115.1 anti-sigma factor [Fertoeibacter niger]